MPMGVIVFFEMVQVEEDQGKETMVAFGPQAFLFQAL
jgi:hypothetical protein